MTGKMTLSFRSPTREQVDQESLEKRKEDFKKDEELMRETTKFVSEVIEVATFEVSKRKLQAMEGNNAEGNKLKGSDVIANWNNRARGFCNRVFNAIFPCFTENELFAWASYRYRFPRP